MLRCPSEEKVDFSGIDGQMDAPIAVKMRKLPSVQHSFFSPHLLEAHSEDALVKLLRKVAVEVDAAGVEAGRGPGVEHPGN